MKGYSFILLMVISSTALSQTFSDPTHVELFEKTGTCENCDLSGLYWLSTKKNGFVNLTNSNLIRSTFQLSGNSNRQHSNFSYIVGIKFSMSQGDFSYSNFVNADLRNSYLANNNFTSCDFSGANLTGSDLSGSILYKAQITKEQLNSVGDLCYAILPDGQLNDC